MFFKKIKNDFFVHKKLKKTPQKVAYLWQLGVFFLCSPDCPKQPRTPFYKFFHPIVSAKVSAWAQRQDQRREKKNLHTSQKRNHKACPSKNLNIDKSWDFVVFVLIFF